MAEAEDGKEWSEKAIDVMEVASQFNVHINVKQKSQWVVVIFLHILRYFSQFYKFNVIYILNNVCITITDNPLMEYLPTLV